MNSINGVPVPRLVAGNWNRQHTTWATVDGRFKIVRRPASKGVTAAWILYFVPSAKGVEFTSYGAARKMITDVVNGKPALAVVPEKNKGSN